MNQTVCDALKRMQQVGHVCSEDDVNSLEQALSFILGNQDEFTDKKELPDLMLYQVPKDVLKIRRSDLSLYGRVRCVRDLTYLTKENILNVYGMGNKALKEIEDYLAGYGIFLKDSTDSIDQAPIFSEGDIVYARFPFYHYNRFGNKDFMVNKGDRLEIVLVKNPCNRKPYWAASYRCTTVDGKTVSCSAGMIQNG